MDENIKLLIELPKWYYEELKTFIHPTMIDKAIINGIPLPKNHGRLIDADYLKDVILLHNFHGNNKNIVPYADRRGYRLRQREVDEGIINAPTIIEEEKCR